MFRWLKEAARPERQTVLACYSGWCLDAFDSQMLALATPFLLTALALTRPQAGLIASVTLMTTALGGWLGGALSDSIGRLRTLKAAVIWFAVFSLACAFATDYTSLIALKALQGFGFGAEWAAGAVLITETFGPPNRGKAMGLVQSGWATGWGLAVLVFMAVSAAFDGSSAWRVMFAIGVLPALFVLWVLRNAASDREKHLHSIISLKSLMSVFRSDTLKGTLAGGLLGVGAHGGYYGLFTWLPTFLRTDRGLSAGSTGAYLAAIIVSFGIGCLCAGHLVDYLGRRPAVAIFVVGCAATITFYLLLPVSNSIMLLLGFPLGFFAAGIPAAMGTIFSELFSSDLRGSGVGFCYNFGRVLSAAFPATIGLLSERMSLGFATGVATVGAYSLVLIALLLLPTRLEQSAIAEGYSRPA